MYRVGLKRLAGALLLALCVPTHAAFSVVMTAGPDGTNVPSLYANARSITAATQLATARCAKYLSENRLKGKCSVFLSGVGPGYVAIVNAAPGKPASVGAAVAASRQEAVNRAYAMCRNGDRYDCKGSPDLVVWDGGHQGLAEPLAASSVLPMVKTALR